MKIKISILFSILVLSMGCRQQTVQKDSKIEEGMIKVAILYPAGEDKTFDMDYYSQKHMPMAAELFGDNLKAWSIDEGLSGGAPGSGPTYHAVGYFYFPDMPTMGRSMETHSETLRADVPNYTNIKPVLQVSEVKFLK